MSIKFTITQQTKILELIHPFFPIPQRILPAKEHRSNKQLVMFRNNKRNSRQFLTLKEGHNIYITKEIFLWRRSGQSCDSTTLGI